MLYLGSSESICGFQVHHLKNGDLDGAGSKRFGGYPQPPQSQVEAAEVVKA